MIVVVSGDFVAGVLICSLHFCFGYLPKLFLGLYTEHPKQLKDDIEGSRLCKRCWNLF